ncbi:putative tocopherol cyclase [Helianthus anomalus]
MPYESIIQHDDEGRVATGVEWSGWKSKKTCVYNRNQEVSLACDLDCIINFCVVALCYCNTFPGWIEWGDERYEFKNAPSYCEKNWGGGFPRKWFWVQCNVFKGASGEVGLTCGGGLRQLPGLNETFENAALIGVHHGGIFYEFVPWNGVVEWEVAEWGYWHVTAQNETHKVELEASTKDPGTTLRAPTTEAGFAPACKDTCFAHLTLKLWEKGSAAVADGKLILDVTSDMAAVEVGGGPWFNTWKGKTYTPEIINRALNLPVDVDGILGSFPLLKPPGL